MRVRLFMFNSGEGRQHTNNRLARFNWMDYIVRESFVVGRLLVVADVRHHLLERFWQQPDGLRRCAVQYVRAMGSMRTMGPMMAGPGPRRARRTRGIMRARRATRAGHTTCNGAGQHKRAKHMHDASHPMQVVSQRCDASSTRHERPLITSPRVS